MQHAQAPAHLSPIFAGRRLTAFSFFDPSTALPTTATIMGTGPHGTFFTDATISDEDHYLGDELHKITPKILIRDLEEDSKTVEACSLSL